MENENKTTRRKTKDTNEMYNSPFATRLRSLIEENNLTQAAVAQEMNTTRQTIGNWMLGKSQPDFDTLIKLADYFNTTTDFLLGHSPNRTTDINIQAMCNYTGLSEDSIYWLHMKRMDYLNDIEYTEKEHKLSVFFNFINYLAVRLSFQSEYLAELLLNYEFSLSLGDSLNDEYLKLNNKQELEELFNKILEQDKQVRYARFDFQEAFISFIDKYFFEIVEQYKSTKEQVYMKHIENNTFDID